jgi:hypothetical protein
LEYKKTKNNFLKVSSIYKKKTDCKTAVVVATLASYNAKQAAVFIILRTK